jgi:hypothetical protein
LNTLLASLSNLAARARFWRRPEPAHGDKPGSEVTSEPAAVDAAPEPEAATGTSPARRILGRLAFWRRSADAEAPLDPEADPLQEAALPPPTGGPDTQSETAVRPFAKRVLGVCLRKTVWVPAAAMLLLTVGATGTMLATRAQYSDQEAALRALAAQKLRLEQENQQLRARPAIIPAPTQAPSPTLDGPGQEAAIARPPARRTGRPAGSDCLVTDKATVGESLRRCIEAFNQATSAGGKAH